MTLQTQEPKATKPGRSRPLECEECSRGSHDGRGWRVHIAFDPDDGEPARVTAYCPQCWAREFGA